MLYTVELCVEYVRPANKLLQQEAGSSLQRDGIYARRKRDAGVLGSTYGDAEIIKRVDVNGNLIGRIAIKGYLDSRQGVIAFGQRHIDLWNGTEIHGKDVISDGVWDAPSAISQGIFFWDVSPAPPSPSFNDGVQPATDTAVV